jgi:NhaA family Na+:H+ antiporter
MTKAREVRTLNLFKSFFESEKAGGFVLLACTALSILVANSAMGHAYASLWHLPLPIPSIHINFTLLHWINDGLMTVFFLLVGLEIERELYAGELSGVRKALLPIAAAVGGMIVPILIYSAFHYNRETIVGFGIPMATDIAFALGILSLLGSRVPLSLKIFLTALAIIDDLGAILVIALFYAEGVQWGFLLAGAGVYAVLIVLNRLRVPNLAFYLVPGVVVWYCLLKSGVHPTITGVLLAFAVPFIPPNTSNPSYSLQLFLHKPVAFVILPLFALANTVIALPADIAAALVNRTSLAIMVALFAGKAIGIFSFTFLSVKIGLCTLPKDLNWRLIFGVAVLGGIGFTMSIFITNLSFADEAVIVGSKMSILLVSAIAALVGYALLRSMTGKAMKTVRAEEG